MTTQELRELDAWIAEHVMGWADVHMRQSGLVGYAPCEPRKVRTATGDGVSTTAAFTSEVPYYTDSADAMDVLKKCAEKHQHDIAIGTAGPTDWRVWAGELNGATYASSLELAICLFAKQLFSKPTTK